MSAKLEHIDAIVWDFDGVHWNYESCAGTYDLCDNVAAEVATALLPGLGMAEAINLAHKSFAEHSNSVDGFVVWAGERGHDTNAVREQIFRGYHASLFNRLVGQFPIVFQPDAERIAAFAGCQRFIRHALGTHSCVENIAKPLLNRMGLLPYFNPAAIVDLSHVDYAPKSKSTALVELALSRIAAEPKRAAFVEDALKNLAKSKEIDSRLTTVYVHHGKKLDVLPSYVDIQTENPTALMRLIAAARPRI